MLHFVNVSAKEIEAVLRVGQRQQIAQIHAVDRAPREVLRDEHWFDLIDQRLQSDEVIAVELLRASQR
jgi:hypothetical protein